MLWQFSILLNQELLRSKRKSQVLFLQTSRQWRLIPPIFQWDFLWTLLYPSEPVVLEPTIPQVLRLRLSLEFLLPMRLVLKSPPLFAFKIYMNFMKASCHIGYNSFQMNLGRRQDKHAIFVWFWKILGMEWRLLVRRKSKCLIGKGHMILQEKLLLWSLLMAIQTISW